MNFAINESFRTLILSDMLIANHLSLPISSARKEEDESIRDALLAKKGLSPTSYTLARDILTRLPRSGFFFTIQRWQVRCLILRLFHNPAGPALFDQKLAPRAEAGLFGCLHLLFARIAPMRRRLS